MKKKIKLKAPEEIEPKYENYTIEKLPKELKENLNLDESALWFDTNDAEDPYSITTVNDDGTKTLRVFGDPVKYIDEETDKVEFIDTTLTAAKDEDNAFECVTNSKKSYFPKDISKGVLLTNGKKSVTMTPVITETKKNGKIKYKKVKIKGKSHAQYDDVFGEDTSLQYVPTVNGIKENIMLEEYNGTNTFSYIIDAKKLVPKETEGTTITFIDPETEEEVFKIDETFIYDSRYNTSDHDESCVSYNNYYTVEQQKNGKYLLTTVVDKDFLESPETVYPATIDPLYAWTTETSKVYYGSFPANENYVDTEGRCFLGRYNETQWRTYVRFGNFERFYFINPEMIKEADIILDLSDVPQSTTKVYAGTSTIGNSVTQSPDRDECFGNLTRIAEATITAQFNNYIDITNDFQGWLESALESGSIFVPGCVLYVPNNTTTHYEIIATYKPQLTVCYRDDHSLKEDLYFISNGNHYLYAEETDNGTIQTYWKEHNKLPSSSYNSGYLWYAKVDSSNQFYTLKSYKKFSGERNYYLTNNSTNNSFSNSDNDVVLKPKQSTTRQQWHIVSNLDSAGTYRIINNYVVSGNVIDALTKSSSSNINCLNYECKSSQKWKFTTCPSSISVADGVTKSVSSWPTNAAKSSGNYLYGKTPQKLEYKANGTLAATGSGTAAAYVGSSTTNGSAMTDGIISGSNVDIRGYSLTQEGENGYMRYINRNTHKYRKNGMLYLDIVYNLGELKDVNCLWLATNTADTNYQIGAFEVYTAQGTESLFFTRNKRGKFDHTSGRWSGVACVDFSVPVTAKYIGIRVTQGVVKKSGNATWSDSELEHAYARIRDIAAFYIDYKKLTIENYFDDGLLERWNSKTEDIKSTKGIPKMQTIALQFFKQLEYNGQNIGLDVAFSTINRHQTTADKCPTAEDAWANCICDGIDHKAEQTILSDFATNHKNQIIPQIIPILWTGHVTTNDNGKPVYDGAATYPQYGKHVIMLNTGGINLINLTIDDFSESKRIQSTYVHELCHVFGAADSYCYNDKDENEQCSNSICTNCHPESGYSANCIMADLPDEDFSANSANTILCNKCKEDIYNYVYGG